MAVQKKITDSIEESIQSLAGDIYVQIEEKVAELVRSSQINKEISSDDIKQHPLFIALNDTNNDQLKQNELAKSQAEEKIKEQQSLIETLQQESITQQNELKNIADLKGTKLTDTESVLKEKLSENSVLKENIKKLEVKAQQQSDALDNQNIQIKSLFSEVSQLTEIKANLTKTDQAKAAAMNAQNQQISDLKEQLNIALAEQAHAKAEFASKIASTTNSVSEHQTQAIQFAKECENLTQQLNSVTAELATEKSRGDTLANELTKLKEQSALLDKTTNEQKELIKSLQENEKRHENELGRISKMHEESIKNNETLVTELKEQLAKSSESKSELTKSQALSKELETKLVSVEQELAAQLLIIKQYNEKQEMLTKEKNDIQRQLADNEKEKEQFEQRNQTLADNVISLEKANQQHQNKVDQLSKDLLSSNEEIEKIQQRFVSNRDKQESEYTQARETIKYLRDENNVLNEKLTTEITALETQLTEYRLRFEYAQKQLAKQS